jgi:hypothetical protein
MLALLTLNLLGIGWIRDAIRMEMYLQGCVQASEPGNSTALEEVRCASLGLRVHRIAIIVF